MAVLSQGFGPMSAPMLDTGFSLEELVARGIVDLDELMRLPDEPPSGAGSPA